MSTRPLSQLTYTRFQDPAPVAGSPTVITLHGANTRGKDFESFARAAAPDGRLLGLESYKGVFAGKIITGYTWYPGPLATPPPMFYGDALMELERFLLDEVDRQAPRDAMLPFLIGVEQGAIMALAAALAVPDLLSGVVAIEGRYPVVPGWDPPLAPLERLPILIMDPTTGIEPADRMLTGDPLLDQFRAWDADVTSMKCDEIETRDRGLADWIRSQPIRYRDARRD